MSKVLFVCLGNICRSAMAEGLLKHKVKERGLNIQVDSAGTSSYHIGEAPDERMQAKAQEYGIDISNQKARQFTASDFSEFDYIFAMDESNKNNILNLAFTEEDKSKVKMFLNYSYPNRNMSVPDPYYGRDQGFEDVYQLLNDACDRFLETLDHE